MLTRTPPKYIYTVYGLNHKLIYASVKTPNIIIQLKLRYSKPSKHPTTAKTEEMISRDCIDIECQIDTVHVTSTKPANQTRLCSFSVVVKASTSSNLTLLSLPRSTRVMLSRLDVSVITGTWLRVVFHSWLLLSSIGLSSANSLLENSSHYHTGSKLWPIMLR